MAKELRSRRDIPTDEEGLIEQYGGTVLTAGSGLLIGFIVGRLTASGSKDTPVALVELAESIKPKLQVISQTQAIPRIQDSNSALSVINSYITALESSYEGLVAARRQQQENIPTQLLSRAGYNIATIAELNAKLDFESKFQDILEYLYSIIKTETTRASSTNPFEVNSWIAFSGKLSWFLTAVKSLYLTSPPANKATIHNYIDKIYEYVTNGIKDPIVDIFLDSSNIPPAKIAEAAEDYFKSTLSIPLENTILMIINRSILILDEFKNQTQQTQ